MGKYEAALEHVARPADPNDRDSATSITLSDYEALYYATKLREYAEYDADDDHRDVALAYVEYINEQVRNRGNLAIRLYAHTETAVEVLERAFPETNQAALPNERIEPL